MTNRKKSRALLLVVRYEKKRLFLSPLLRNETHPALKSTFDGPSVIAFRPS